MPLSEMIPNAAEEFGERMFERSVGQILDNLGFHSATQPVLEILGLLAKRYFEDLCRRIALHQENSGSQHPGIGHVIRAFGDQLIDIEEIHTYMLQVGTLENIFKIPAYPVKLKCESPKGSCVLQPNTREENCKPKVKPSGKIEIYSAPFKTNMPNFAGLLAVEMGFEGIVHSGPIIVPAEPMKPKKAIKKSNHVRYTSELHGLKLKIRIRRY